MITVNEAVQIIQSVQRNYGTQQATLKDAIGQILQEDLCADRPFPPFDRVTMDGIALQYQAFAAGQRSFSIENTAAAGAPQLSLNDANACLEVMTGAILPKGTNTVIRYEDLTIENGKATVNLSELIQGKNVHRKGSDRPKDDLLIAAGTIISPAEIGVAATVGKSKLKVSTPPRTIIISTGDELVDTHEIPLAHQIRKSNVYLLQSIFTRLKIDAAVKHLQDDYAQIVDNLRSILADFDVIILSGGVSMGKFDYLPKALEELGVKAHFHKVKQRPGKPLWFGESPDGAVVFALPGNPVSSFSCAQKYVLPWLRQSLKLPPAPIRWATLTENFSFKPALTYFLQVKINSNDNGKLEATPLTGNGSGDLANLSRADGFLELPADQNEFEAGEAFPYVSYRLELL